MEHLEKLQRRGSSTGGASSTDVLPQTEGFNLIPRVVRVQCRWQWMVATVLVESDLQRVEMWVDPFTYVEVSSAVGRYEGGMRRSQESSTSTWVARSSYEIIADEVEPAAEPVQALTQYPSATPPESPADPAFDGRIAKAILFGVRAWMLSASAATRGVCSETRRYIAGLRAASQAYEIVRIKAWRSGSLARSLDGRIGAGNSVRALAASLRDTVVKRGVCAQGGFSSEEEFLDAMNSGFEGAVRRDDELKSQLLKSYHHVMPFSKGYFKSHCSQRAYRPRKDASAKSQVVDDGHSGLDAHAAVFQPQIRPYQKPVYFSPHAAWLYAADVEMNPTDKTFQWVACQQDRLVGGLSMLMQPWTGKWASFPW
jgi:hypothetical protein